MLFRKRKKNLRNIYIIDSENTFNIELLPLKEMDEMDKVVIFMSENSKTIKPKVLHQLMRLKCNVETEFVEVGSANALDFQLVVYLTKSCLDNFTAKHFVLSNDKGFEKAISYINKNGIGVVRLIEEPKNEPTKATTHLAMKTEMKISLKDNLTPLGLKENEIKIVEKCFNEKKELRDFHNALIAHFGENGRNVYKACKTKFNEK